MVWKSNLNETEQELIDDLGGKTSASVVPTPNEIKGSQPCLPRNKVRSSAKKNQTSVQKGDRDDGIRSVRAAPRDEHHGSSATLMNAEYNDGGISGSGEELAQTLEKVVSQLDIISRTLHVLEQRVSMNEESVQNVISYFKETKELREAKAQQVLSYNE